MNTFNSGKVNANANIQTAHDHLHSCIVSDADPEFLSPVCQIQESRRVEDPGMFGSKIAVLAFTSSLQRSLNLFKVDWSAPSRTIAARAQLYTLEYCAIRSEMFWMADRDRVRIALDGAERITCEY